MRFFQLNLKSYYSLQHHCAKSGEPLMWLHWVKRSCCADGKFLESCSLGRVNPDTEFALNLEQSSFPWPPLSISAISILSALCRWRFLPGDIFHPLSAAFRRFATIKALERAEKVKFTVLFSFKTRTYCFSTTQNVHFFSSQKTSEFVVCFPSVILLMFEWTYHH